MYAIIETGGKQIRVEKDAVIFVEKLEANEGDTVTFDKVLYADGKFGKQIQVGVRATDDVHLFQLDVYDQKDNVSTFAEELIKYIKHVRNEFLKDHKIIKTPSEILGENINISVDLITRDKNKTMQEKFADMMFIYDALKIKMKKNIIQRSILNYYNDKYKDKFIPNMDYSTITNYSKIAINYIDNLKYKELINPI